jgi:two-component system chemotaxis response regulator CheY
MQAYDLSDVRVLVIDSSHGTRQLVQRVLRTFNVQEFSVVNSGGEALTMIPLFRPDLIIVDTITDDMDGFELTRLLRSPEVSDDPFISIVMMSGFATFECVKKGRDAGANEFLAKPWSPKSLYTKIASVIENPRNFVKSETFFGPDRRRKASQRPPHPDRRGTAGGGDLQPAG